MEPREGGREKPRRRADLGVAGASRLQARGLGQVHYAGIVGRELPIGFGVMFVSMDLPAAISIASVGLSGIRRSRHWLVGTASSDFAMSSQLPCLGV